MEDETKAPNLRAVDCCATCRQWAGWLDDMWCRKYEIDVNPYSICDDFETNAGETDKEEHEAK
jgi:hypothetical protein